MREKDSRPPRPAPRRKCLASVLAAGFVHPRWRRHWRRHAGRASGAAGSAGDVSGAGSADSLNAEKLRAEILQAAEGGGDREVRIAKGLEVLDAALRLLGPDGLVVAFNGGKDATVVLHLARAAMAGLSPELCRTMRVMYLPSDDEFPEVDAFVKTTGSCLSDIRIKEVFGGLKAGLKQICEEETATAAADVAMAAGYRLGLGFVLGTKKGDPNAKGQGTFEPSSPRFPPFWRVNPILHWTYADVWHFLRHYSLPYCSMYDRGYTSIGQQANTLPNPTLRREDGSYAPAYELADDSFEREGRVLAKKTSTEVTTPEVPLLGSSCGLLVIGNEVLKGMTHDRNSAEAIERLRDAGVSLGRVAVVRDDTAAIAEEVRRQSSQFDFVVTSGGVGPTHDDVTLHAVATAFGMPLAAPHDARFAALLQGSHGPEGARLPAGHALRWLEGREWPVLQVRNVFVLPGVPELFAENLRAILASLVRRPGSRPPMRRLRLALPEVAAAELLRDVARAVPQVTIGSYPESEGEDGVTVTVESRDETAVSLALERLLEALPADSVLSVDSENVLGPVSAQP